MVEAAEEAYRRCMDLAGWRRAALWLVSVVMAVHAHVGAQVFRSTTDLINVTAAVVDRNGAPATGLKKEDFIVLEDGVPQDVAFFSAEELPASVALVVDTSGSMVDKIDDVRDALAHFVDRMKPEDEVSLLRFSTDVEVLVRPGDSRDTVRRAIGYLRPSGGTALLDAVAVGLSELRQARYSKRALLLITDGNDNQSRLRERDAIALVTKSEVLLYALGIGHSERGSFGHDVFGEADRVDGRLLEHLANPTGGRSYVLEEAHRRGVDLIDRTVQQIADELRQQYSLGYYPTNPNKDGTFRRIDVKVRPAGYRVRAKTGYVAPARSN